MVVRHTFNIRVFHLREDTQEGWESHQSIHDGLVVALQREGRCSDYTQHNAEGLASETQVVHICDHTTRCGSRKKCGVRKRVLRPETRLQNASAG